MNFQRTPETCHHRRSGLSSEVARCTLLECLLEGSSVRPVPVDQPTCHACCDSFTPTVDDWNPVIASLVFQSASERSLETAPGPQARSEVQRLMTKAIEQLPVVLRYENDLVDDLQGHQRPTKLDAQAIDLATLHHFLPVIASAPKRRVERRWSTVITTSPRRQPTLQICFDSMVASGWRDPEISVDGSEGVTPPSACQVALERVKPIGAWPAWIASLRYLVETQSDVLMIVQDDTLFPGIACLKESIDQNLWPNDHSILSLYTSSDDTRSDNCWQAFPRRWALGALAMVFPRDLAVDLLAMHDADQLSFIDGDAGIDTRIGVWAQRRGVEIWHPSPSLVQHIGQVSTVWESSRAVGIRRASRYIADEIGR